jgi:outer membrane protein insertion porin family/translocation and assembly module TamA
MHILRVAARSTSVVAIALVGGATGCASLPPGRSAVDAVDIVGAEQVDPGGTTDRLATTASPKFLGLFRGVVYDYSVFDAAALQRDLARVERYYHGRGFFEAHARTARVVQVSADHVRVEIAVDEGPPTLNRNIRVNGLNAVPQPIAEEAERALNDALPTGARFDEDAYDQAKVTLTRSLTDRGYAYAKVDATAEADALAHAVDYDFDVDPGPATTLGEVRIVSVGADASTGRLEEIGEAPVRRVLQLRPGAPYSTSRIDSATQALLDLKVFSAVEIVPELTEPPSDVVPLTVKVTPTKLRSLRLGGGLELDEIKTETHALIGWEDLNFFGDLRNLTVDFQPGVVLYPTTINNFVGPSSWHLLPQEHFRAQLNQNAFIESRTSLFIRPEVNVYPLLVQTDPDPNAPVVGYVEPKGAIGLQRRFGRYFVGLVGQNLQTEIPFSYQGTPNPMPPGIVLSYPQLTTTLDFRDDKVHPHAGLFLTNDLQAAGLGGNASDLRVSPEARGYVPIGRRVTLAVRGTLGFLFAYNYGQFVQNDLAKGPPADPVPANRDIEITYFRGFFSGGPGSNRGYPVRGIAPHGYVPFLNPATARMQVLSNCNPMRNLGTTNPQCWIPIGGFTQWESSVELRFDVAGPFGVATFCDAGDVSQSEGDIRLSHLHLSCGAGIRYATPVGPVRLDVGYRIQPLQVLGFRNETELAQQDPVEGTQPTFLGAPLAVAFGLGEAF